MPPPRPPKPAALLPSMVLAVTEATVVPPGVPKNGTWPRLNQMPPPLVPALFPSMVEVLRLTCATARAEETGAEENAGRVDAEIARPPPVVPAALPEMMLVLTVREATPSALA